MKTKTTKRLTFDPDERNRTKTFSMIMVTKKRSLEILEHPFYAAEIAELRKLIFQWDWFFLSTKMWKRTTFFHPFDDDINNAMMNEFFQLPFSSYYMCVCGYILKKKWWMVVKKYEIKKKAWKSMLTNFLKKDFSASWTFFFLHQASSKIPSKITFFVNVNNNSV